jgi:predicted Zn-dependent peptidase
MHAYKKITLPNGLRAVFIQNPQSVAVTSIVLVNTGADYESKAENGISHFLEHLCFKGTEKRPSSRAITRELDEMGAQYNAFTDREVTAYYVKVGSAFFEQSFDIVSDIYLNSTFDEKEIEKERGVIIEEMHMYEDKPETKVYLLANNLVYGDQPVGRDTLGTENNIKRFKRKDFVAYHRRHYVPKNTVVVVAGNFPVAKGVALVRKRFGALRGPVSPKKARMRPAPRGYKEKVVQKKVDQTHLLVRFESFSGWDKRRHALAVLEDVLGGSMSSRLWHAVREELGAAYYVYADSEFNSDRGAFYIGVGANHGKVEAVLKAIRAECKDIAENGITREELERSKKHLCGRLSISLETSNSIANFYGAQEAVYGKSESPKDIERKIRAVTAKEVHRLARELFTGDRQSLSLIGPFKGRKFGDIVKL